MSSETHRISNNSTNIQQEQSRQILPLQNLQQEAIPQQYIFQQQQQNLQQQGIGQQVDIINKQSGYPQAYSQPIIVNPYPQNYIINNQASEISSEKINFGKSPLNIICPYCMRQINTKVEREFNYFRCMLMTLCIFILHFLLLYGGCDGCSCRDCDCRGCCCCCCCCGKKEETNKKCCDCCYDGIHFCPNCKSMVGNSSNC